MGFEGSVFRLGRLVLRCFSVCVFVQVISLWIFLEGTVFANMWGLGNGALCFFPWRLSPMVVCNEVTPTWVCLGESFRQPFLWNEERLVIQPWIMFGWKRKS